MGYFRKILIAPLPVFMIYLFMKFGIYNQHNEFILMFCWITSLIFKTGIYGKIIRGELDGYKKFRK